MSAKLTNLLSEISQCRLCESRLNHEPRPIVQANHHAKLLIVGQAPGSKVHASGVPWDDASGDRLRAWLAMDRDQFYSPDVAIVPMGFCYPGRGRSGDLPPRPECAPQWHNSVMQYLPNIRLTLLIGLYAQRYYLTDSKQTLTGNVKNYRDYLPTHLPLPHPSPRNNIWLKKNPWFETNLLPELRKNITFN